MFVIMLINIFACTSMHGMQPAAWQHALYTNVNSLNTQKQTPYGILLRKASVEMRTERGQQTLNAESQLNEVLQITFQYQKSNVLT